MIFKGTTSSLTPDQRGRGKSRRDGTLLTVDFNLRGGDAARHVSTSPAGTIHWMSDKVPSLRDSSQLVNLLQVVNSAFHTPDFNYTDFGTIKVK